MIRIADPDSGSKTSFSLNHSPHRVCFYMLHMWIRNEGSLCVERHTMESADISIPLFDHNNGKCWRQHAIVWRTTMESADVSIPLFDAQQWKCKSLSTHKCKSLSTQSLFLRAPYVDQERSEPLCGECPWTFPISLST